jgi:hypothetical protein
MMISAIQAITSAADPPKSRSSPQARTEPPAVSPRPYINPSLRLDAALGLVVIEFRDDSGALTSTIPSERQIEAYRAHQEALPGQKPDMPPAAEAVTPATPAPEGPSAPTTTGAGQPAPVRQGGPPMIGPPVIGTPVIGTPPATDSAA